MDPPKDYHERMQRLGEEFAHMTHEFTASIQGLSETTQELAELMLSERGVSPRAPDPPIKKADDYHVKAESSSKTEPPIKVEKPDPALEDWSENQNAAAGDPRIEFDHSDSEHNPTSCNSKTRKRKHTQISTEQSDAAKPEEQLCFACLQDWAQPLKPGEKLKDCLTTPGSASSCDQCSGKNITCTPVPENLVGCLLQRKHEINNALDGSDALEERLRFIEACLELIPKTQPLVGSDAYVRDQKLIEKERERLWKFMHRQKKADKIKLRGREYRKKNADKIRLQKQKWYLKNADKMRLKFREYRKQNADKIKLREREFQKQNADKIRLQKQEHSLKNADKIRSRNQEYYLKNTDKIRLRNQEYYLKNADKLKLKLQEYGKQNADKIKLRKREYRKQNADNIKLRDREWRKQNPDKIKSGKQKWYLKNADKIKQRRREYQKQNADNIKLREREYRKKNADKINSRAQKYYHKNAEKIKLRRQEYHRKNTDKIKSRIQPLRKAGDDLNKITEPHKKEEQASTKQNKQEEPKTEDQLKAEEKPRLQDEPKSEDQPTQDNERKLRQHLKLEQTSNLESEAALGDQWKKEEELKPKVELT